MKKLLALALVAALALVGCQDTQNDIAAIVNPVIGTWTYSILGVTTTLVFNADKTCTETSDAVIIGYTNNGTWTSTDTEITRTWSDSTVDVQYYTLSDDNKQLTLSSSPSGLETTYTKS